MHFSFTYLTFTFLLISTSALQKCANIEKITVHTKSGDIDGRLYKTPSSANLALIYAELGIQSAVLSSVKLREETRPASQSNCYRGNSIRGRRYVWPVRLSTEQRTPFCQEPKMPKIVKDPHGFGYERIAEYIEMEIQNGSANV
ncbi:hypothetical protein DdX_20132 [Ditylenchus destructor]|uniref:Uncharacterized protein n=1 Tax=Ditylenchus destructor TaxID=166010 RepID=A0AAD4MHT6_9BILA|nr:hypothetical protein DdX_20132 [Ditylenchus destructor]